MHKPLPFLIACATCTILASAQPLLIQHVRVFDGTRVLENTSVLVEGSIIHSIGPTITPPNGARVVDGTGKTLLPGLIDAHTHTIAEASLQQAPIFGVTTDLDMFTIPESAAGIKKQQREGKLLDYADLRSAGYLATAPGGHGTEYGINVPTLTKPREAQAWVDARIAEGSDYIKVIYDDALEYGAPKATPTLTKETLQALAVAAHARGKLIVMHIGSLQQAIDAINAGADGLAHLFVGSTSSADFGKLAAAHHIFVVPTLTVLQTICATKYDSELADDARLKPYLPPSEITAMKNNFGRSGNISCEGANEAIRQLKAAHVPRSQHPRRNGIAGACRAHTGRSSARGHVGAGGRLPPRRQGPDRSRKASGPGVGQRRSHHRHPQLARHRSRLEGRSCD
jgi:hypothetical protein